MDSEGVGLRGGGLVFEVCGLEGEIFSGLVDESRDHEAGP